MKNSESQPNHDTPNYWFPAKRYGYGWGFPTVWQGWVVMHLYFAIVAAAVWLGRQSLVVLLTGVLLSTVFLIAICYWKGEPPRWRWGDDGDSH